MPLYEIVLCYPDRDEVRFTDHDPREDGEVRINGMVWPIVSETAPVGPIAEWRFLVSRDDRSNEERPTSARAAR